MSANGVGNYREVNNLSMVHEPYFECKKSMYKIVNKKEMESSFYYRLNA